MSITSKIVQERNNYHASLCLRSNSRIVAQNLQSLAIIPVKIHLAVAQKSSSFAQPKRQKPCTVSLDHTRKLINVFITFGRDVQQNCNSGGKIQHQRLSRRARPSARAQNGFRVFSVRSPKSLRAAFDICDSRP